MAQCFPVGNGAAGGNSLEVDGRDCETDPADGTAGFTASGPGSLPLRVGDVARPA
jgi:hypothetical protein